MFGFVVVNEHDLSEAEMARYRQVYCGVCRALHRQSGQLSRMTLNHDLTFMALLHISLYEPAEETGYMRCLLHPINQRSYTSNAFIDYAADMTVVMAYHKLMDNWYDDRNHPSLAFAQALKGRYREIKERYRRQCLAIEEGLGRITELERSWKPTETACGSDEAANAFGRILAEIFVIEEDMWANSLREFAYEIGRFIYMMDAAIDADKDREKGSFNPFAGHEFTLDEIQLLLANYMARATMVFERLPLIQDEHILRSVLYAGVWQQFNEMSRSKSEESQETARISDGQEDDGSISQRRGSLVVLRESNEDASRLCALQNDAAPVEMPQSCTCTDGQSAIIHLEARGANEQDKEPVRG